MSVYYIHAPEAGLVKIGYASDPRARLVQVQVHSPTRVLLLAVEDGGRREEVERHKAFASLRARGEWFKFEGALKAHVEALAPWVQTERKQLPGPLGAWITAHGHGVESFAEMMGTTAGTVSRICSGKMSPGAFVRRIYDATGGEVDANALFGLPPKPDEATEPAAASG